MLPVVVSSSTKFSRQAASCRDNISKRVSLFSSRKLRGDLDPANVEIQRTWGLELRIRFRVELLSEEWFSPSVFRRKWTRSAPRKLLSGLIVTIYATLRPKIPFLELISTEILHSYP